MHVNEELKKSNPLKAEIVQIGDLGSVCFSSSSFPRTEYISTRWYRAPECLLTVGYYGSKMDIWALGCCFYEMLTFEPLFPGESEIDQLFKIHEVLGSPTPNMLQRFKHLSRNIDFPKKSGRDFYKVMPMLSQYGADLLKKMLMYHPENRLSADKLIGHNYFDDIRQKMSAVNLVNSRLLPSSKSESAWTKTKPRNINKSLAASFDSLDTIHCKSLKRIESIHNKLTKKLERNWNRPTCPIKDAIISNLKSSVVNQRNVISLNSSLNE